MYDDREQLTQGAAYTWTAYCKVSAADPLVKAALTLKGNLADADPGALQKIVTTSNVAGTGQITFDGSATSGLAAIRFDFTGTDTLGLSPRDFWMDVKCKTSSGAPAFAAGGILHVFQAVTTTVL